MPEPLPSLVRYGRSLEVTAEWLMRSLRPSGGSSACWYPFRGWGRAYPETTGYLIPTLLALHLEFPGLGAATAAERAGHWLLEIQHPDGWWSGGKHPPRTPRPSVFNTAQILTGLVALYRHSRERRWLEAASRGAAWMANGVSDGNEWTHRDYRTEGTPSYYSHAVHPMLDVWEETGEPAVRAAAESVLTTIVSRAQPNGAIARWGFENGKPAPTHTIAYTMWGLLEAARLLGRWEPWGAATVPALERLLRRAELAGGRLPGAFTEKWQATRNHVCLTGNAQVALCLLRLDEREADLRLVSGAAKLVDYVCSKQWSTGPGGVAGGVAGSWPLWGDYMSWRYPNWAAKYHCDALMALTRRILRERDGG